MRKYLITVLFVIFFMLSCVGCSAINKNETVNSTADYPASIMVNDKIYLLGQAIPAEVDDSAIIGYTTSYTDAFPSQNGETNFNRELNMPYAKIEEGIAVLYENEWHLCSSMEEDAGAPLAPVETDMDLVSVSHIEVMSGFTGQRINVKNADSVQKVMDDIESLTYQKMNAAEKIEFAYRIRFYNENYDELGRIFITEENGNQISYDGYYYLVEEDLNINVAYLEELLKDAPPAEPGDEGYDELSDIEPIKAEEMISYNGKEYLKSELCNDTLKWLELSEEERMLSSYFPPEFMMFDEKWGISLTVEDITSTGATIKCTQSGGQLSGELQTGSWFILENWTKEEGWKEVPDIVDGPLAFTADGLTIPMNEVCEWEVKWEWIYGQIPEGKYRIGKEIMDFREAGDFDEAIYYAEFEIVE